MEAEKYNSLIPLQCPTCGSTQFEHSDESALAMCASCGRELTRDELIREKDNNIQEDVGDIENKPFKTLGSN